MEKRFAANYDEQIGWHVTDHGRLLARVADRQQAERLVELLVRNDGVTLSPPVAADRYDRFLCAVLTGLLARADGWEANTLAGRAVSIVEALIRRVGR